MAHRWLRPPQGRPLLEPAEVLARLRTAFAHVDGDPDEGADQVDALLAQLRPAAGDPAVAARVAHLEAARDEAVYVTCADAADAGDAWIGFPLIPGEPLFVGFTSPAHEAAAAPLVARCAEALGYQTPGG